MIINDKNAVARLNSPMNLINRLQRESENGSKKNSAMSLFGIGRKKEELVEEVTVTFNPFSNSFLMKEEPQTSSLPQLIPPPASLSLQQEIPSKPVLDDILKNHDSQIKLGLAHDNALELLNNSVKALAAKLDDVKADKLPSVISAASKTVESIRKERNEAAKNGKDREVHFHFYTPTQKPMSEFEVIDVA